jgi:hypothetical protein
MPSQASGNSKMLAFQSSQGTQPGSPASEARTYGAQKTTYAKTTSSGTLKTTSEVIDSSQAPQSVILTSIFPTPDMPSSSKGGDTLSGVSPQVSTSHVSSAPGAASQSSIFRRASDTTSSTPSIHSSDLGQAFLSSIGNAEPTLSYTPSQSLAVAEPSKTSGTAKASESPKASESLESPISVGSLPTASITGFNSFVSSSQASSALSMQSSVEARQSSLL